jgi:Cdc6-like AAA superfamily ATPase
MFKITLNKGETIAHITNSNDYVCIFPSNEYDDSQLEFHIKKEGHKLELVPQLKGRSIIFIAGKSGCGKTTFAINFMNNYLNKYPSNNAIVLTPKPNDETIKALGDERIKIWDVNSPKFSQVKSINPELFKDSIVFFDDIDFMQNENLKDKVETLRDQIIGIGREFNTSIIISKHLVMDYQKTRKLLAEATYIVVFPRAGSGKFIDNFFKTYFSQANSQIINELSNNSRWICCRMDYPDLIFGEKDFYILK